MLRFVKESGIAKIYKAEYAGYDKQVEVDPANLMSVIFSESIETFEGWTLRDLLELIQPYGDLLGDMAWCNFQEYFDEMNKPLTKPLDSDVKYIDLQWIGNLESFDGVESLNDYIHVNGTNDYTDAECADSWEKAVDKNDAINNHYAIEFTPVNELAHLPIRLNESYTITRKMHEKPYTDTEILKTRKAFTLLDVVWSILWELSFMGTVEKRDAKADELRESVKEIENGTATFIPVEEVEEVFERLDAKLKGFDDILRSREVEQEVLDILDAPEFKATEDKRLADSIADIKNEMKDAIADGRDGWYRSQIPEVERLIKSLPADNIFERKGLEARLEELKKKINGA